MAFKGLCVLALLALVHAETATKAYDKFWRKWLKLIEPGGLDDVLELIHHDAVGIMTSGPKTEHTNLREYFESYRASIAEAVMWDGTSDVLKVSGPTVTSAWNGFGVFKNGCKWTMRGFSGMDFNIAGKVTYMVSTFHGLEEYMACLKGKSLPVGDVVPGPWMPPGFAGLRQAQDDVLEEGGVDRWVGLMAPKAFFEGFKPAIGKVAVLKSYWQPLLKTKNAIFQTVSNVAVFKDGCEANFGGYWWFSMDDEGKCSYMWQHIDDISGFTKCAASEQLAATPQAFGGGASVALTAFVGVVLGAIVSLAAMVALFGTWRQAPGKAGNVPLLQEPRA